MFTSGGPARPRPANENVDPLTGLAPGFVGIVGSKPKPPTSFVDDGRRPLSDVTQAYAAQGTGCVGGASTVLGVRGPASVATAGQDHAAGSPMHMDAAAAPAHPTAAPQPSMPKPHAAAAGAGDFSLLSALSRRPEAASSTLRKMR